MAHQSRFDLSAVAFTTWRQGHNNSRYSALFPKLSTVVRFYRLTYSKNRFVRALQARLWNASHERLVYPVVLSRLSKRYKTLYTTDVEQIPHWRKQVVIDIDDPYYSEKEIRLINQPQVKAIVVTTNTVKGIFQARGVTRPIHVVPQGVELDTLDPIKSKQIGERFKGDDIVVGFIAPTLTMATDLKYQKIKFGVNDIDFLATAIERARQIEPRIKLWLIGNATDAVKRYAEEHSWVNWFSYIPLSELLNYVVNFDIGVYPRLRKLPNGQFSVKLAQYLGCGVSILSTNVDESFIVREAQGGIVADSAESFVEGLVRLAQSPDLRREYGKAGRNYAEGNLDWNKIVPRYEKIILEAQ